MSFSFRKAAAIVGLGAALGGGTLLAEHLVETAFDNDTTMNETSQSSSAQEVVTAESYGEAALISGLGAIMVTGVTIGGVVYGSVQVHKRF